MATITSSEYMNTSELAAEVRTPEATVRYWRHMGTGPRGFKVGRRVLYRRTDVDAWLKSRYDDDTAA